MQEKNSEIGGSTAFIESLLILQRGGTTPSRGFLVNTGLRNGLGKERRLSKGMKEHEETMEKNFSGQFMFTFIFFSFVCYNVSSVSY